MGQNVTKNTIFVMFMSVFIIYAFEALIRYLLGVIHLGTLIYIKDLIIITLILGYALKTTGPNKSLNILHLFPIYILLLHTIVGFFHGNSILIGIFGLKVYFGFLVGLFLSGLVIKNYYFFLKTMVFIWIFSCFGLFLNYLIPDLPWIGYFDVSKEIGVGTTSKVWATDDGARLSGFARASYNAAMIIGVSGLITLTSTRYYLLSIIVATITLFAIHLTTTKGMMMAFSIITIWYLFLKRTPLSKLSLISIIVSLFLISLIMPLLVVLYGYSAFVDINHMPKILSSLGERFYIMWPSAFKSFSLLDWFLGQGVGSIGSPQLLINHSITSFADNFFVYQYVTFGLFSIFYFSYIAAKIIKRYLRDVQYFEWQTLMLIIWFAYGITANMFEEQFFSTTLGIAFGFAVLKLNQKSSST